MLNRYNCYSEQNENTGTNSKFP